MSDRRARRRRRSWLQELLVADPSASDQNPGQLQGVLNHLQVVPAFRSRGFRFLALASQRMPFPSCAWSKEAFCRPRQYDLASNACNASWSLMYTFNAIGEAGEDGEVLVVATWLDRRRASLNLQPRPSHDRATLYPLHHPSGMSSTTGAGGGFLSQLRSASVVMPQSSACNSCSFHQGGSQPNARSRSNCISLLP